MTQKPSVLDCVNQWISLGCLSHLDRAFVRFLLDQDPARVTWCFGPGHWSAINWAEAKSIWIWKNSANNQS